ncbi:MAG: MBOAT family protein [Alphaproteobacteria bacterium]|nr:MBOAT family protein [Alphaproteobacteria bacterium]MDX5369401.1 MBOAT family protein [Alphaproteobacteria bacterium]MDX5464084.1 MBOAT family protein [Alphaproteobacteria bacterium]
MLFNSYVFIFGFLPVAVFGFYLIGRLWGARAALAWLAGASIFFYGWWRVDYVLLLAGSMVGNYLLAGVIRGVAQRPARLLLGAGVAANLGLIAYYKYAGFLAGSLNAVAGTTIDLGQILLPLAISFFTFQQIAYLVDVSKGHIVERDFVRYALFVTFFPQLIAGPIVHHSEMMPQFARADAMRLKWENISVGLALFAIGLFKKAVLADGIAPHADSMFNASAAGEAPSLFIAWAGTLAYSLQLYFDFSGYCDMALGAARMFGIVLPLNFNSPYKSRSIVEFWRRWHMTLSRFLRDYVYVPLGGNRKGPSRRYANLMTTMLLGGLWHGAGWTFVVWGGLHGLYLMINHAWNRLATTILPSPWRDGSLYGAAAWALTLIAVVVAWVPFRATDFPAAWRVFEGLAGFNGIELPGALARATGLSGDAFASLGISIVEGGGTAFVESWLMIFIFGMIALLAPNSVEITARMHPALEVGPEWASRRLVWSASPRWAFACAALIAGGVLALPRVSPFLYFQF